MLSFNQHSIDMKMPLSVVTEIKDFPTDEYCHFHGKDDRGNRMSVIGRCTNDNYFTLTVNALEPFMTYDNIIQCRVDDVTCLSSRSAPKPQTTLTPRTSTIRTPASDFPRPNTISQPGKAQERMERDPVNLSNSHPKPRVQITPVEGRKSSRITQKYREGHSIVKKLKLGPGFSGRKNTEEHGDFPRATVTNRVPASKHSPKHSGHSSSSTPIPEFSKPPNPASQCQIYDIKADKQAWAKARTVDDKVQAIDRRHTSNEDKDTEPVPTKKATIINQRSDDQCGKVREHELDDDDAYKVESDFSDDFDNDPDWLDDAKAQGSKSKGSGLSCAPNENKGVVTELTESPFTLSVTQLLESTQKAHPSIEPPVRRNEKVEEKLTKRPRGKLRARRKLSSAGTVHDWKKQNPSFVYGCKVCPYTTKQRSTFKSHLVLVHKLTIAMYKQKYSLDQYDLTTVLPQVTSECSVCGSEFASGSFVLKHASSVHNMNELVYHRHLAGLVPAQEVQALQAEIQNRPKPAVRQKTPQRVNKAKKVLATTTTDPANILCELCGGSFRNTNILTRHMKSTHSQNPRLKECLDALDREKYPLITPEMTFKCRVCDAEYTGTAVLSHTRSAHSGVDKFTDIYHGTVRMLNKKQGLRTQKVNMALAHSRWDVPKGASASSASSDIRRPNAQRKYGCEQCDASFNSNSGLSLHIKTRHGDQKPKKKVKCKECGKIFFSKMARSIHVYNDHRAAPTSVPCTICGQCFPDSSLATIHKDAEHPDNATHYSCTQCGDIIISMSDLKTHKCISLERKKRVTTTTNKSKVESGQSASVGDSNNIGDTAVLPSASGVVPDEYRPTDEQDPDSIYVVVESADDPDPNPAPTLFNMSEADQLAMYQLLEAAVTADSTL